LTRSGPSQPSDAQHGANRLTIARGFLDAAQVQVDRAKVGTLGNPIAATVVNAAIAYTDPLTATFGNKINQGEHSAVVKTLRDALGTRIRTWGDANVRDQKFPFNMSYFNFS